MGNSVCRPVIGRGAIKIGEDGIKHFFTHDESALEDND